MNGRRQPTNRNLTQLIHYSLHLHLNQFLAHFVVLLISLQCRELCEVHDQIPLHSMGFRIVSIDKKEHGFAAYK